MARGPFKIVVALLLWRTAGVKIVVALLLAQEDCYNCKKFAPHPQKRLDIPRFFTYTGARYTKYDRRRTTTGAPAPKFCKNQGALSYCF